jgi:hypothetical protein
MEHGTISTIDTIIVITHLIGIMAAIQLIVMVVLYAPLH